MGQCDAFRFVRAVTCCIFSVEVFAVFVRERRTAEEVVEPVRASIRAISSCGCDADGRSREKWIQTSVSAQLSLFHFNVIPLAGFGGRAHHVAIGE